MTEEEQETKHKLDDHLGMICSTLQANGMRLNRGKTQLLNVTTRQQAVAWIGPSMIYLNAVDEEGRHVTPQADTMLLGMRIQSKVGWTKHVTDGPGSLLYVARKKFGALKSIGHHFATKERLKLCQGLVMSRVLYGIQLWAPSSTTMQRRIQAIQNRMMRWCMKMPRNTRVTDLLSMTGWMLIHQLTLYHSVLLLRKIVMSRHPEDLYSCLKIENDGKI